jgi:hypothetical protein
LIAALTKVIDAQVDQFRSLKLNQLPAIQGVGPLEYTYFSMDDVANSAWLERSAVGSGSLFRALAAGAGK